MLLAYRCFCIFLSKHFSLNFDQNKYRVVLGGWWGKRIFEKALSLRILVKKYRVNLEAGVEVKGQNEGEGIGY